MNHHKSSHTPGTSRFVFTDGRKAIPPQSHSARRRVASFFKALVGRKRRAGIALGPLAICLGALSLLWPDPAFGADIQPFIVRHPNGAIDWTTGQVRASGIGAFEETDAGDSPAAETQIVSQARGNAEHNLVELLKSICVHGDVFVKDLIAEPGLHLSQLIDMAHNAPELKEKRRTFTDGAIEVHLRFDLFGGFAQLVLPEEIKQIQPLALVLPEDSSTADAPSKDASAEAYTGLVVDARGIRLEPAMAPRIVDEKNQEIYGATVISREFAVQQGVFRYVRGASQDVRLPRVGQRPLVVNGLRATGPNRCDIVISNADAAKVKRSTQYLSFLKQCRVVVLMDAAGEAEDTQ